MNKKIYLLLIPVFCVFLSFTSCDDDNDDNDTTDYEWKSKNETDFSNARNSGEYLVWQSNNDLNNVVLYKESTVITDSDKKLSTRITKEGTPEFTDTIVCRYEGWYFDKNNNKIIFDSTENPSLSSSNPNKKEKQFAVSGIIEGFSIALQHMSVNDEYETVIPWRLGYGYVGDSKYIPGYTTLYFRIKLLKIIPMKGRA